MPGVSWLPSMSVLKSNPGMTLAACYSLIMAVVLYFAFQPLRSVFWFWASGVLTLPWSMGVGLLGFLLIHITSNGMEYGFAVCAVLNAVMLYRIGDSRAGVK